jgi:hypothetical protein
MKRTTDLHLKEMKVNRMKIFEDAQGKAEFLREEIIFLTNNSV